MQIAVDVDGTIFKWSVFPSLGEPVPHALETLRELRDQGHELLLWTCRKDESLDVVIEKLKEHGIAFHYHNEHPEQEHLSNKLDADVFIDDKALGCPLIWENDYDKPWVDWTEVRAFFNME